MDKNVKQEIKVVENNDKLTIDERITIKELEEDLVKMKEDKEKKCASAKEQLVDMLEVTVDKYRTATGTMEALRTLRLVTGDNVVDLTWANKLAWDVSYEVEKMIEKAKKLSYAEMDKLCVDFYDQEFKVFDGKETRWYEFAYEMMRLDLCRNVGPAAEDMVEFIKRVEEEIDKTGEKLKDLKAKEK